jgi:hypothetical protein
VEQTISFSDLPSDLRFSQTVFRAIVTRIHSARKNGGKWRKMGEKRGNPGQRRKNPRNRGRKFQDRDRRSYRQHLPLAIDDDGRPKFHVFMFHVFAIHASPSITTAGEARKT